MEINWNIDNLSEEEKSRIYYMSADEFIERTNLFNRYTSEEAEEIEKEFIEENFNFVYYPPSYKQRYSYISDVIYKNEKIDIPYLAYENSLLAEWSGFNEAIIASDRNIGQIPVTISGVMPHDYIKLTDKRDIHNKQVIKELNLIHYYDDKWTPLKYIDENGNPLDEYQLTKEDITKINDILRYIQSQNGLFNVTLDSFIKELINSMDIILSDKNIKNYTSYDYENPSINMGLARIHYD